MKKLLTIIFLSLIILGLALADYSLNLKKKTNIEEIKNDLNTKIDENLLNNTDIKVADNKIPETRFIKGYKFKSNYIISRQIQSKQIFETIDLSNLKNVYIYQNRLDLDPKEQNSDYIIMYQILNTTKQNEINYLNLKMQILDQIDNNKILLNETNEFGANSFYLNNPNLTGTTFLLTQIKDSIYAFQYSKENPKIHDSVKEIIQEISQI